MEPLSAEQKTSILRNEILERSGNRTDSIDTLMDTLQFMGLDDRERLLILEEVTHIVKEVADFSAQKMNT